MQSWSFFRVTHEAVYQPHFGQLGVCCGRRDYAARERAPADYRLGTDGRKLSDTNKGKVLVGKGALEDYIAVLAQEIYGIHNVKVIVKLEEECINVRINSSIEPGINIPETSEEIKTNVRESIKKVTGIEVKDIELFFKQIKAKEE